MRSVRLRHVVRINPPSLKFNRLDLRSLVTFLPMESVWPGPRLDLSRRCVKADVVTGYTRFESGDVLVPKITPTFEAGRAVLVPALDDGVGVGTTELHVLRPGAQMDGRFLSYVVNTHAFLKLGEAEMYGVAGQKRVPDAFLRDLLIDLPPLDEQRRIADFLDTETSRIDQVARCRENQKALIRERFHTQLVETLIPKQRDLSWASTRLKYLFRPEVNGIWGNEADGGPDDTVCVRVADFDRDRLVGGRSATTVRSIEPRLRTLRELNWGDVLLEKSGGGIGAPVGFAVTFDGEDGAVCSNFVSRLRPTSEVDKRYAGLLMAAQYFAKRNTSFIKQTTGIQNLDGSSYLAQRVSVPILSRQQQISREVNRDMGITMDCIAACRRQLELLAERRQALITAAVTGQLDVTTAHGVV